MPQHDFFVDLHCHPTYKPFGRSFRMGTPGQASNRPGDLNSVWNYDPPGAGDKLLNFVKGLTRFSQANLTAAAYGRTGVMTVSLGSIEKGFFRTKLGTGALADLVSEFTAGLSVPRINHIQNMTDYFADLLLEWDFLLANNEKFTRIDGMNYAYSIVSSFQELEAVMDFNDSELEAKMRNPRHAVQTKIALVLSIEGLHVLNTGLDQPVSDADVLDKVRQIKTFDKAPFFVTFSHHFNNDLCGHARSLPPPLNRLCDQEKNIGTGFSALGEQVLRLLLDRTVGRRVLIDIKHMSALARREFFAIRDADFPKLPIIVSHGAANGRRSMDQPTIIDSPETGEKLCPDDINFYDDEIVRVVQSNGIFGLQLDERRLADDETIRRVKHSIFRHKILHYRTEVIWRQFRHIAELLDRNGLPSWDNLAIGSDYDGIVNPVNGIWTVEDYDDMVGYLERHIYHYMVEEKAPGLTHDFNKISPDEIIKRISWQNAWSFFKRNF
ncbi:membrane dipeptidase [Tellurirhabdus rosea]|uniref:membrane dipeptidase n=1 Tax=Tellurirhabdus rosea TaxID=2674997 RepID=UPI00224EC357|nr:membrane dipeptidase [Tellurirhabdus rosea]